MHPDFKARIRIVQSPANRWVKQLRAAVRRPPRLGEHAGLLAPEGPLLIGEALRSGWMPLAVFLREDENPGSNSPANGSSLLSQIADSTQILLLPAQLFDSTVQTESPQGVAALLASPEPPSPILPPHPLVLVLAGVQDPGNVGALLRSAEAFGAHGAIFFGGTATPWSGKALRASAGSAFRMPLYAFHDAEAASAWLRARRVRSFAAVALGGSKPDDLHLARGAAIWIGNEGAGLTLEQLELCEGRVTLPMPGRIESLNAAIAGSLLLYEAARQRAASLPGRSEARRA